MTSKLNNELPSSRTTPVRVRRTLAALEMDYATCSSSIGPCPRSTTATSCRPGGLWRSSSARVRRAPSACPTSRSRTSSDWQPRPTPSLRSTRSRHTPTSPMTTYAPTTGPMASRQRPGRPSLKAPCSTTRSRTGGQRRRPDACPGCVALAHPARRHRVPEVHDAQRIKENFELFDFELDDADVEAITALNKGEAGRTGPNPDVFAYVPTRPGARRAAGTPCG